MHVLISDRRYSDKHEWVSVNGKIGIVGISSYAQVNSVLSLFIIMIFAAAILMMLVAVKADPSFYVLLLIINDASIAHYCWYLDDILFILFRSFSSLVAPLLST